MDDFFVDFPCLIQQFGENIVCVCLFICGSGNTKVLAPVLRLEMACHPSFPNATAASSLDQMRMDAAQMMALLVGAAAAVIIAQGPVDIRCWSRASVHPQPWLRSG